MVDLPRDAASTVWVLLGGRRVNMRMAMFINSLLAGGKNVRLLALPRQAWRFDALELTVPIKVEQVRADIGIVRGAPGTILCFHWIMLPLAWMLSVFFRCRLIYDEHDHYALNTLEGSGGLLRRRIQSALVILFHRLFLRRADLVTCIHLNDGLLTKELRLWNPNVIELDNLPARAWFQASKFENDGPVCFVYAGGVYAEKGADTTIAAFEALGAGVRARSELHIFGPGRSGLQFAKKSRVSFHGEVSPSVIREFALQNRCVGIALLRSSTRYNLVGTNFTKLYEYLAMGMPVIASKVGELPAFVERHQVGLLVEGHLDSGEISQAMEALVSDRALFDRFSHNARKLMNSETMSWDSQWQMVLRAAPYLHGRYEKQVW